MSHDALSPEEPDTTLDPYETLGVDPEADDASIRSAYKKLALKHHPDKVAPADRETAHVAFQNIAFAYAILSDPKRRRRYDTTGSTAESALDDADFDWAEFFRARYTEVSRERIVEFEKQYKGGDEEREHLLEAYKKSGGRMGRIYQQVMLSNPLQDEKRFQSILKEAIEKEEVPGFDAFLKETAKSRKARMDQARREAEEAEEYAEELGLNDTGDSKKRRRKHNGDVEVVGDASSDEDEDEDGDEEQLDWIEEEGDGEEDEQVKPSRTRKAPSKPQPKPAAKPAKTKKAEPKSGGGGGLDDLAAKIQQRQQGRASFLDDLEAKYAPKSGKGKKRAPMEEPPEEAFARTAARAKAKKSKS